MSYQYLKPKDYYSERYDLHTIENCLDQIKMFRRVAQQMKSDPRANDMEESEIDRSVNIFINQQLLLIKGTRHRDKESTIIEWMKDDEIKQNRQDSATPPEITCDNCNVSMKVGDYRTLIDWPEDQPMRVLFFYDCPKCKKRAGAYDDGQLYESKTDVCPKCNTEVKRKSSKKGEVLTITTTCPNCAYKDVEVDDFGKNKVEREAREKEEAELLAKYRKEFCLSDEDGKQHVELLEAMKVVNVVYEETLAELDTPAQAEKLKINKLSVSQLEDLLTKELETENFILEKLGQPNIEKHIVLPFTARDTSKRKSRESESDLKDALKKFLKDTNWRLMTSGLHYRLGYLSGQLKGYERDDDLLNLVSKEQPKPKKPTSKIDPKLRDKYSHHNVVQLAKMSAEFEARENIRKRRLKDEPDGFFLEASESRYTCGICGESHYGEDIWWRSDGLRCRNCWRNIQNRVIPVLCLESRKRDFIKRYELKSKYGIHPSSIKKLRREGKLVGRDLLTMDGSVYCTVYLMSDNLPLQSKLSPNSR